MQSKSPVLGGSGLPRGIRCPGSLRLRELAARHGARFGMFSVIGASIFVLQFAGLALLVQVWHAGRITSYVAVLVTAIQMCFLLNRRITWRDREVSWWVAWRRFNLQKAVTAGINFLLYASLVKLGVNYLVANVLITGALTVVNYAAGHSWSFAAQMPGGHRQPPARSGSGAGVEPSGR